MANCINISADHVAPSVLQSASGVSLIAVKSFGFVAYPYGDGRPILYRAKFRVRRQYRRICDALSIADSKRWAVRLVGQSSRESALRNAAIKLRNSRVSTESLRP